MAWFKRFKRFLWGCDHDWVWMHDTPEKQATYEQDYVEWFEDYPLTAYPMAYRCKICGLVR